jgi:nucleotide-binding universal stress UspA family protein
VEQEQRSPVWLRHTSIRRSPRRRRAERTDAPGAPGVEHAGMATGLIGTDGSAHAADAAVLGRLLADALGAEPVLVHADGSPAAALQDEARRIGAALTGCLASRLAIVVGSSHQAPCAVAVAPAGYAEGAPESLRVVGCGFDGTAGSREALRLAGRLVQSGGGTVRVIAVHEPVAFGSVPDAPESRLVKVNRLLRDALAIDVREAEEAAGVGVAAELLDGDPVSVLAEASERLDVLVLGSRGYGRLGAAVIGSVPRGLVSTARCPVVVAPRARAGPRLWPLAGVLAARA